MRACPIYTSPWGEVEIATAISGEGVAPAYPPD